MRTVRSPRFLNTDQGYQFPETLVSVYGTDAASPVAIVALSFVPQQRLGMGPLSFSGPYGPAEPWGPCLAERASTGSVRIVNGAKDPFAPLFAPEDQWASLDWLVQRFACLNDFRRSKLILEYREPLPASLKGVSEVPVYNEAVQAFRERAAKVFHVQYGEAPMPKDEAPYIKTLNARYMGNFLGSMSVKEPLFPNYSD